MEISKFFSAAEGRLDQWRTLHRIAKNLVGVAERDAEALRQEAQTLLADMEPIEDFCGYPGPRLMAQMHERLQTGDRTGFARRTFDVAGDPGGLPTTAPCRGPVRL